MYKKSFGFLFSFSILKEWLNRETKLRVLIYSRLQDRNILLTSWEKIGRGREAKEPNESILTGRQYIAVLPSQNHI